MFIKASRQKVRFSTTKGELTVEDLWDLPLTSNTNKVNLDDIARGLFRQLKNDDGVSFVEKAQKSDETIQLKFDIAKYIIDVRLAENEASRVQKDNKDKKQTLLAIIAQKETESLMGASLDDLRKMAESL